MIMDQRDQAPARAEGERERSGKKETIRGRAGKWRKPELQCGWSGGDVVGRGTMLLEVELTLLAARILLQFLLLSLFSCVYSLMIYRL